MSDVDTNPPVITGCPVDSLQLTSPPGTVYAFIQWERPTAVDDTGPAQLISETGPRSPTFVVVNQSPQTVEYVFEDLSGNEATCRFTVSSVGKCERFKPKYKIVEILKDAWFDFSEWRFLFKQCVTTQEILVSNFS